MTRYAGFSETPNGSEHSPDKWSRRDEKRGQLVRLQAPIQQLFQRVHQEHAIPESNLRRFMAGLGTRRYPSKAEAEEKTCFFAALIELCAHLIWLAGSSIVPGSGASPHSEELLSESSSWAAGPYKDVQGAIESKICMRLSAQGKCGLDFKCLECLSPDVARPTELRNALQKETRPFVGIYGKHNIRCVESL